MPQDLPHIQRRWPVYQHANTALAMYPSPVCHKGLLSCTGIKHASTNTRSRPLLACGVERLTAGQVVISSIFFFGGGKCFWVQGSECGSCLNGYREMFLEVKAIVTAPTQYSLIV